MFVVVVAEDEPVIRMETVEHLTDEGFEVLEAGHAEEALAILAHAADDVHVHFTDVRMPGKMDGVALSHHVKAHWPWIGLLVTSAHAEAMSMSFPRAADSCRSRIIIDKRLSSSGRLRPPRDAERYGAQDLRRRPALALCASLTEPSWGSQEANGGRSRSRRAEGKGGATSALILPINLDVA